MSEPASTIIGIISDTHYWPQSQPVVTTEGSTQLQPWSEQLLDALIVDLKAAQVDLIIHLGDLSCGGGSYAMPPDAFSAAIHTIHRRLHELGVPVMAIPGNHDAKPSDGDLSEFNALWQYEPGLGKTIDLPQARLILLNAMGHTPAQIAVAPNGDPVYGWVCPAELQRLDAALSTAEGRPVLIFTHQLLQPWVGSQPWRDYFGIANASEVLQVIEQRGGVRAIFQGHAHRLDLQMRTIGADQSCTFVVVPAIIEYPVGWVQLNLNATQGRYQLRRLPLDLISTRLEHSGDEQGWRKGDPAWQDRQFSLF